MIVATSVMGIALLVKLHTCNRISPVFSAFVAALCVSKLFLLLFPQDNAVPAIMVFLLSALPAPAIHLMSKDSASYFQMSSFQVRQRYNTYDQCLFFRVNGCGVGLT